VLAGWALLWVFWAFGVTDRKESELVAMMTGHDMAFCGLFQYMIVLNGVGRSARVQHGSEYH
jgi:hypothetical protein